MDGSGLNGNVQMRTWRKARSDQQAHIERTERLEMQSKDYQQRSIRDSLDEERNQWYYENREERRGCKDELGYEV